MIGKVGFSPGGIYSGGGGGFDPTLQKQGGFIPGGGGFVPGGFDSTLMHSALNIC